MKSLLIILIGACTVIHCSAQRPASKSTQRAKHLVDSAANRFLRANGEPDSIRIIIRILDAAIKADSTYYDAWANKMSMQCKIEQYSEGLKSIRKMEKIFPQVEDLRFFRGVVQYKCGLRKEATATFNELLQRYNATIAKNKKDAYHKQTMINKGIILILLDKTADGKNMLQKIYDAEKDPFTQSYIGFYIKSDKETIINDRVPGN